jgi:hypothetical protein
MQHFTSKLNNEVESGRASSLVGLCRSSSDKGACARQHSGRLQSSVSIHALQQRLHHTTIELQCASRCNVWARVGPSCEHRQQPREIRQQVKAQTAPGSCATHSHPARDEPHCGGAATTTGGAAGQGLCAVPRAVNTRTVTADLGQPDASPTQ